MGDTYWLWNYNEDTIGNSGMKINGSLIHLDYLHDFARNNQSILRVTLKDGRRKATKEIVTQMVHHWDYCKEMGWIENINLTSRPYSNICMSCGDKVRNPKGHDTLCESCK